MNYKEIKEKTKFKFESGLFNPGDIFSEMFSYWIVVISNNNGLIKTLEGTEKELTLVEYKTPEEFHNKCKYKFGSGGYWIDFMSNNHNKAAEYIDWYCYKKQMSQSDIREFKLNTLLV